jgi:hypothetical protein
LRINSQIAVRFSGLSAGLPLPQGRFLILICVRGSVDPRAIVRLEGLGKLNKSNDLIGNRTRDLPTCRIGPQQIMIPRTVPKNIEGNIIARLNEVGTISRKLIEQCWCSSTAFDGGVSASRPRKPTRYPLDKRMNATRGDLNVKEKTTSCPCQKSYSDPSVV